jgi:3-isopropylmalate/(R)-2-methylmalate dehydratase large subunit
LVACPDDPSNVKTAKDLEKKNIKINQGFIGSCTNGRFEDLKMAADVLLDNKVHPDVRLIISPSSVEVWKDALKEGLLDIFVESEALVTHPTCGPCMGSHLGILATDERCISTQNRNFKGRMGHPNSEIYLSNSATVAASCIEGKIVDPRKYTSD